MGISQKSYRRIRESHRVTWLFGCEATQLGFFLPAHKQGMVSNLWVD